MPTGRPSCSAGPATPVRASPTSASSTRRAPCAISSAAVSLTTGPSLTPSNCCFTSVAYDTIDPRNTVLEPGTPVRRAPTNPPVTDSANPSDQPLLRSRSSTTDSIDSSSAPNTSSPSRSRSRWSQTSSSCRQASRVAALAVSRTLRPFHPLARNASVGLPASSSSPMMSSSRSLRPLSLSPHVSSVRLAITDGSPERRLSSGKTRALEHVEHLVGNAGHGEHHLVDTIRR